MRKMASIQIISALTPIEGADRIVAARVLGWTVVVGKNDFSVGEKIVFMEPDTFLPATNPLFSPFLERGKKTVIHEGSEVVGHVLRTAKLRGVYSQGLIMGLEKLGLSSNLRLGEDVTEAIGVFKYEPPIPADNGQIVGAFDTRVGPKTDAIRAQAFSQEVWELIQTVEWEPTLKVDGTSRTIAMEEDRVRIFSRNWEIDPTQDSAFKVAQRDGLLTELPEGWAVQAELVGPGIQGNKLKFSDLKLIPFAVWKQGVKVPRSQWPSSIGKHATPILGKEFLPSNFATVEEALSFVDKLRNTSLGSDTLAEGVVFHPVDPQSVPEQLATVLDRNSNWKLINPSFLVKHSE